MHSKHSKVLVGIVVIVAVFCLIILLNPQNVFGGKGSGGGGGGSASSMPAGPYSLDLEKDQKQYLSILDRAQSGLDLTGDITFEAWVQLESVGENNTNSTVIDKGSTKETSVAYRFYWRNNLGTSASDDVNLLLSPDGTTNYAPYDVRYPVRLNEWTHLATTFNMATNKVMFYVNGQPLSDNDAHPTMRQIFANNHPFYIGSRAGTFDFMDGKMDEVRVWNVVRTPEEILATLRQQLTGSEPGLVGYWNFNGELVSGKMKDNSPSGNHLQLNSGPTFSSDVPF